MPAWLYNQIQSADPTARPDFSLQSTLNWAHALRHEIEFEHGTTPGQQYSACKQIVGQWKQPKSPLHSTAVFEPLISAITFAISADHLAQDANKAAWLRPTAVINWYYAIYRSCRSILASRGQPVHDTHTAVYKAYANNLAPHMPHPFNMLAQYDRNEKYTCSLPDAPQAKASHLSMTSSPKDRGSNQGKLLQYLSGTSKYYVGKTKQNILAKASFTDFLTKAAQSKRDDKVQKKVSFLHCAYRYRGKANYRDGIYLTYGSNILSGETGYCKSLFVSARFITLFALAVADRCRATETASFLADVSTSIKGIASAPSNLRFWEGI